MKKASFVNNLSAIKRNAYLDSNVIEVSTPKEEIQEPEIKETEITVKQTEEFIIPKIEITKKEVNSHFSYYGKKEYIDKIKKIAKSYKVTPSSLLDSILKSYLSNTNEENQIKK